MSLKIKPRFQKRLVRKSLAVFLALLTLSILITTGFIFLFLYLFLPAQGIQQDSLSPFLIILLLQSLGIFAASILFSVLIYTRFTKSTVKELLGVIESMKLFTNGSWDERAAVSRNDEIGILANQYNLLAEEMTTVNTGNEKKIQETTYDIEVMTSISKMASTASSKKELLRETLRRMVETYGYHEASVYLIDETGQHLLLTESYGNQDFQENIGKIRFGINSETIIGRAGEDLQTFTVGDVNEFYPKKRSGLLFDTLSEAAIPLTINGNLLGVMNIQSKKADKFGSDQVAALQNLSNLLAVAMRNVELQACSSVNIEESTLLLNLSQRVAKSESVEEIIQIVEEGLAKTNYCSILLTSSNHSLKIVSIQNKELPEVVNISNWPLISITEVEELLPTGNPLIVSDFDNPPNIPGLLLYMLREWQVKASAFLPVVINNKLTALFIIATRKQDALSNAVIQPYANLAELVATAVHKLEALQTAAKRQKEIQALQIISEAVAGQTTMFDIYTAVHKAIQNIIGDVNFLIALYSKDTNLIQIPYLFEGTEVYDVDPFPLGEGLTSILIKTQQPLMLVHDTERRTSELGAKIVGAPAKSWLGVPMILRGEILGALIVQDLEREGRFTEDDQQLLLTAAVHVGSAVQAAHLLEQTSRQAEREKQLYEITKKIRRSTDMRTILATTASEIGKSLGVFRTSFEILPDTGFSDAEQDQQQTETSET
jgi:GAF domain-containing protein